MERTSTTLRYSTWKNYGSVFLYNKNFNGVHLKCVFSNQLLYLTVSGGMVFMQNLHTYAYKYVVNNQSAA